MEKKGHVGIDAHNVTQHRPETSWNEDKKFLTTQASRRAAPRQHNVETKIKHVIVFDHNCLC